MVRRPPRPTRPELRRPPPEPVSHRVVVPEDDDAEPVLRPRGHVSEFLPLADVLPAARARRADEPLVRASQGMRWEEPAGAQLAGLEVERPTEVAPARAPVAPAAPVARPGMAGPVAVAGGAWAEAAPTEPRVSTHRQLALLAAAVGMFVVSVLVVVVVLVTGERSAEPGAAVVAEGAPAVATAATPAEPPVAGGEAAVAAGAEVPAGRPAVVEPPRREPPPPAEREAPREPPALREPLREPPREPPRVEDAPPPPPKPKAEPKAPKVAEGMRAVGFRFNGDWGGGTAQVSCGPRFHVEKALSGGGARVEIKAETCEATVRCAEGGGRTSLSVRASATEVVCAGCTADAPQPVCSVR